MNSLSLQFDRILSTSEEFALWIDAEVVLVGSWSFQGLYKHSVDVFMDLREWTFLGFCFDQLFRDFVNGGLNE